MSKYLEIRNRVTHDFVDYKNRACCPDNFCTHMLMDDIQELLNLSKHEIKRSIRTTRKSLKLREELTKAHVELAQIKSSKAYQWFAAAVKHFPDEM